MMQTTIGTRIRELRTERCLTQEDLAAAVGMDARTVQRIEHGEQKPRPRSVRAFAKAFGISIAELCDGCRDHGAGPHTEQTPGGRVTLIASPKAGTGRTTLAIALWGALRKQGYRLALVDFHEGCGAQAYVAWAGMLRQAMPTYIRCESPAEAIQLIPKLRHHYDHVVIDSSACETSDLVPLALRCNHILLTTDHPQMDFGWGGQRTQTWLDVANGGPAKTAAVLVRASHHQSRRLKARRYLESIGLPVLNAELINRTAYDRTFSRGTTVMDDDPTGLAAGEVYALAHELGLIEFPQAPRSPRDRRLTKEDMRFWRAYMDAVSLPRRIVRPSQRRTSAKSER